MVRCGVSIRQLAADATSMEDAAHRIVDHLHQNLTGAALVRCYKVHRFDQLPPDVQDEARPLLGPEPQPPDLLCLAVLATAGDAALADNHRVTPLASAGSIAEAPILS